MSYSKEKTFDLKVKLSMRDYFRYYLSLFSIQWSGKLVNLISAVVLIIYTFSLFTAVYVMFATKNYNLMKGITLNIGIIFLFSAPFIRAYLVAYHEAKTHNYLDKETHLRIADDKIIVEPDDINKEYYWRKMYKVFEFSHGFALFIDKKELAFAIPKRSFKSKEQVQQMQAILRKHAKSGK